MRRVNVSWSLVHRSYIYSNEGWSINRPVQRLSVCLLNPEVSLFLFILKRQLISLIRHDISLLPLSAKKGSEISAPSLCDPSFPRDKTNFLRQRSAGCRCKVVAAFGFTPAHRGIILWMNAVEITYLKFYAPDKCHLICFVNQYRGWGKEGYK